jgi:hypothetical protein
MHTRHFKLLAALITAGCVMVFLVGANLSPIVSGKAGTPPQGEAARFKNVNTWYLYFKVTIDGENGDENDTGEPDRWSVHDSFSGNVALNSRAPLIKTNNKTTKTSTMSRQEQMAAAMTMLKEMNSEIQWTATPVRPMEVMFNGILPFYIKIHEMTLYGGKDTCGDYSSTTNTRNGDGNDFSLATPRFVADTEHLTYNIFIPLNPESDKQQATVKQVVRELVNKKPQDTVTEPGPHDVPFKDGQLFGISRITVSDPKRGGYLLKGGVIHHEIDVPLDVVSGYVEYDSGDVEPDEPLIKTKPNTKTKVKVHIYYKLSKTPINPK